MEKTKRIKKLKTRCPKCGSSQIRHRRLIGTWKCDKCKHTFKKPDTSDMGEK